MVFVCDEDVQSHRTGHQMQRLAETAPGSLGAGSQWGRQYFAHGGGRPDPVPLLSRGQVWAGCGLQVSGEP